MIQPIMLGILAFLLVASCRANSIPPRTQIGSANSSSSASECRVIQHAIGEVCVPIHPQRVVTIDPFSLENVFALGVQPVSVAISADWLEKRHYLHDRLSGIERAGDHSQPNLEKILALKPDLILGLTQDEDVYSQLKQIAPTVLFQFENSGQWKEILKHNAETLNKTDAGNQLMAAYSDRLNKLKTQIKTQNKSRSQPLEVSVIRIYPNTISIYASDTFIGSIVDDAGLVRPSIQNQPGQQDISKERLQNVDGDVLFVWSNEVGQAQQEVKTRIDQIKADPLWQQLKVVQQGKVYEIPSYWIRSSILTANRVIDDLFKYLVEAQ